MKDSDASPPDHDPDNLLGMNQPEKVSFITRWLENGSALYDGLGFALLRRFINATLHGWYVYSKNNGSLFVGAATFFGALSVIPVLSCSIFILGFFYGSTDTAHIEFFSQLKSITPHESHVLLEEVARLTAGHLQSIPLSLLNAVILVWAANGFFGNLTTGLMKVTNTANRGGQVMETLRSLGSLVAFGLILLLCFELSARGSLVQMMKASVGKDSDLAYVIGVLATYQVFTIPSTIAMVTLLFRWVLKSPLFACIEGSIAFLTGFFALKSFYWIYLHYHQAETVSLYGGFAPMVIGLLWGYFMLTAFFIGACVASLPRQKQLLSKIPKVSQSWDEAA